MIIFSPFFFFGHTSVGMEKNKVKSPALVLSVNCDCPDQQHRGIFQSLCLHQAFPAELGGAVERNRLLEV